MLAGVYFLNPRVRLRGLLTSNTSRVGRPCWQPWSIPALITVALASLDPHSLGSHSVCGKVQRTLPLAIVAGRLLPASVQWIVGRLLLRRRGRCPARGARATVCDDKGPPRAHDPH